MKNTITPHKPASTPTFLPHFIVFTISTILVIFVWSSPADIYGSAIITEFINRGLLIVALSATYFAQMLYLDKIYRDRNPKDKVRFGSNGFIMWFVSIAIVVCAIATIKTFGTIDSVMGHSIFNAITFERCIFFWFSLNIVLTMHYSNTILRKYSN